MDLYALAAAQHSVVAVHQLRSLGLSYDAIEHLTESGEWCRRSPMVIIRNGSARTTEQIAAEAVLDAGRRAGLSDYSGAAWFDLNGFRLRPLHVTRLRDSTSTPSRLAVIHEPRLLPDHHLTVHKGVSVTVPSRIPFDIAARGDAAGAERALDRGWARHILNHQSSRRMLDDLAGRGRKGIALMRELLDARGPDYRPNDTNLEDRFQALCKVVGLVLERQRNLLDMGEWLGRVDFVNEKLMLVIEVDSALYHDAIVDRVADAARHAALEAAGYRVRSFTDHEIFSDRSGTLARLRAIRSGA
jgi:very-short-patch-repair endonuclease